MSRKNIYMQARHTLIIDGVPITGFADGDHLQIKPEGNAAARSQGGDGPAMNISVDQGGQITIGPPIEMIVQEAGAIHSIAVAVEVIS